MVVRYLGDDLSGDPLETIVDRPLTGELRHRPGLQDQGARVLEMAVMHKGFCAQEKMHRGQEPEAERLALGVRRTRRVRTTFVTAHGGGPPDDDPRQPQVRCVAQLLAQLQGG